MHTSETHESDEFRRTHHKCKSLGINGLEEFVGVIESFVSKLFGQLQECASLSILGSTGAVIKGRPFR